VSGAFRPCLLIPCYDHGDTVGKVVDALAATGLPCLIVDDGSAPPTRRALEELAASRSFVEVHRRAENGGKGAALITGYRRAAELGFTHVLQLDADDQHDAADAPRMLETMRRHPAALVLGAPLFDRDVPRSRLYGRQISRVMVWLLTLSTDVRDPLCGFRGIPLAPTVALLDRVRAGEHMDFDPELVVRLYWKGLEIVSVPTKVRYQPGGLSHFDVVWDDLRLVSLYSRLLLGTLWRLPRLVARTVAG
jgi:glycosyltransferase involved in cell wall biosynthesis